MEEENTSDLRWSIIGIVVILVIVYLVYSDTHPTISNNHTHTRATPSPEDHKRWHKEYEQYGNNDPYIDQSRQYGGR